MGLKLPEATSRTSTVPIFELYLTDSSASSAPKNTCKSPDSEAVNMKIDGANSQKHML